LTRRDLQQLSRKRVKEARILLKAGAYDGAYYLLGLAVELALKACIAKKTKRFDFPEKTIVDNSYSHQLPRLVSVAGLDQAIDTENKTNSVFAANWSVVLKWRIDSRYEGHDAQKTAELYKAITDPKNGVMACIKRSW
jgi:HEPN domain-containing protein